MSLFATRLIKKKIPDPKKISDLSIKKQYYQTILKNKNKKSVKQSKIIFKQPKTLENKSIVDIKLVTIEHPKTFLKVSKSIRQAEKASQVCGAGKNCDSVL